MAGDDTIGPPHIAGLIHRGLLGSGGFADVYRYEQVALGRDVAVKVIHGLDAAARAQLTAEAHVMARLSSHPFIVPIYQVGESDDGRAYLVMQLCPSPHLGDRLRDRPLPVEDVLRIGVQLAGAVETAHRMGILHRDIKPANILFSEYGHPLLSDFGIAQSHDDDSPLRAWTPGFAPPEQAAGHPSSPAVDVYALCATLWAALTGAPPEGAVDRGATLPGTRRVDVPPALEDALVQGLARDPDDRHPSALALGRALQRAQGALGLPVTTVELWDGADATVEVPPRADERTHLVHLDTGPTLAAAPVPTQPEPMPPPAAQRSYDDPPAPLSRPVAGEPPAGSHLASPAPRSTVSRPAWVVLVVSVLLLVLALAGLWRLASGAFGGGPGPTTTSTSPAGTSTSPAPTPTSTSMHATASETSARVSSPALSPSGLDTSSSGPELGGSTWGQ